MRPSQGMKTPVVYAHELWPKGESPLTVAGAAQAGRFFRLKGDLCFPFNCAGKTTSTSTNGGDCKQPGAAPYNDPAQERPKMPLPPTLNDTHAMAKIHELADRVERLLLRHEELQRTNALLLQQVATLGQERDSLRSRLNAARHRVDALIARLPTEPASTEQPNEGAAP
jgi:cell division protein ZapB